MLFWIFVAITVAFVIWGIVDDWYNEGITFGLIASGFVSILMLSLIVCCNVGIDGQIAKKETRYEALIYQYENDIYDNDNDLGKKELMDEIRVWNEDIANYREIQDDFWIGIFIPNIYDQLEFIELK